MKTDVLRSAEVVIRQATAEDVPGLIDLFHEMENHYQGAAAISPALIEERLRAWFNGEPDAVMLLALIGEEPVGHAVIAPLFPAGDLSTAWFLKDLFVSNKARGKGIGRRLITKCAEETVSRKGSRFDLTVDTGNDGADALYRRLGAVDTGKSYLRWEGNSLANLAKS